MILLSHYILCLRIISIPLLLVAAVIFVAIDAKNTHNEGGGVHKSWKEKSFFLFLIVKLESKQKKEGKIWP